MRIKSILQCSTLAEMNLFIVFPHQLINDCGLWWAKATHTVQAEWHENNEELLLKDAADCSCWVQHDLYLYLRITIETARCVGWQDNPIFFIETILMSSFHCFNFVLDVRRSFIDIHIDLQTKQFCMAKCLADRGMKSH